MAPGFPIVMLSAMSGLNLSRVIRPSHNGSDQVRFLDDETHSYNRKWHRSWDKTVFPSLPLSQSLSPCPPGGEWYLHVGQNAPGTRLGTRL